MVTKEAQINLRLPTELDEWVEQLAGGKRKKPEYIRQLIEREKRRQEELEMVEMFDAAWDSLSEEERDEERAKRDLWLSASAPANR